MKPKIHPDYHEIKVLFPDGTHFMTRSTYGKAGDSVQLDLDFRNHPAWSGGRMLHQTTGKISKFNEKFGNLNFGTKKAKTPAPIETAETSQDDTPASDTTKSTENNA